MRALDCHLHRTAQEDQVVFQSTAICSGFDEHLFSPLLACCQLQGEYLDDHCNDDILLRQRPLRRRNFGAAPYTLNQSDLLDFVPDERHNTACEC